MSEPTQQQKCADLARKMFPTAEVYISEGLSGCPKVIRGMLNLRFPTLPLHLSAVKGLGWWCHCGKTFVPMAEKAKEASSASQ